MVEGGETRIVIREGKTELISKATTTPDSALLFRKDLVHEGRKVTAGCKEILSLNLWASRREAGTILLITFPHEEEDEEAKEASCSAGAGGGGGGHCLLRSASERKSYAIGENVIRSCPECILNGKLRFEEAMSASSSSSSGGGGGKLPKRTRDAREGDSSNCKIVTFECVDFTYEEVGIVFRVLHGMYIRPIDLIRYERVLDFFGLPHSMILTTIAEFMHSFRKRYLVARDSDGTQFEKCFLGDITK